MPLVSIENFAEDISFGLWKMIETQAELYEQYPFLTHYKDLLDQRYRADARKMEFLCAHILLSRILRDERLRIEHFPSGKPFLRDGRQISVSHTKGYVAVIVSNNKKVAVDIEYRSNRVDGIAQRFIREDEVAESVLSKLLHWSAKETLYKYFSETPLDFFEMRLKPFVVMDMGLMEGENLKDSAVIQIHYRVVEDYVLTYTF